MAYGAVREGAVFARLVCALALVVTGPAMARPAAGLELVSEQPFAPADVRQFVVRSQSLGHEVLVVVTPPATPIVPGMPPPAPGAKHPAVYALDGGYGAAAPIAQVLSLSGVMAPAYVVSISYPKGGDGHRNADLLHHPVTENGATYGGGGRAFQAFLTRELRPWLEARYPLDPDRAVLFGHSFGGLFAANVAAEAPDAFAGYVIASASTWRDPQLTQRLRAAAAAGAGRRVFLAAGGKEDARMVAATREIAEALSGPGSAFKTRLEIFEGENHLSFYPKLAQAGLAWTLPSSASGRVPTAVPIAALEPLVGVYALADGRRATITRKGPVLVAELTGMPGQAELLAESPRSFFVPGGFDVVIRFEGPAGEPAQALVVQMAGSELRAVRTAP